MIKDIDIVQKLDQQVPLDLAFRDETGRDIKLHEYFHQGRPIILVLAYYECPMLVHAGAERPGHDAAAAEVQRRPGIRRRRR